MLSRRYALLLSLLASTVAASPAAAQITAEAMGRARPTRLDQLELTGDIEHDSNIARLSSAGSTAEHITPDDTVYSPTALVNVVQPFGREAAYLHGSVGYVFHQNNRQLDSARINLEGGIGAVTGPCSEVGSAAYTRGRNELNDPTLSTTVHNIEEIDRYSGSFTCGRGSGLVLGGQVVHDNAHNSDIQVKTSDYHSTNGTLTLGYGRPSFGVLSLVGSYGRTDYPNRSGEPGASGGYESTAVGLEYRRQLGGRIQAIFEAGYTDVRPFAPILTATAGSKTQDFHGGTYSVAGTYRMTSRIDFGADLKREITPTLLAASAYQVQDTYDLRANWRLGSRITLSLIGQVQKINAPAPPLGLIAASLTNSRTEMGELQAAYRLNKRLGFTFTAAQERRRTDSPLFDYDNTRIALSTNLTF